MEKREKSAFHHLDIMQEYVKDIKETEKAIWIKNGEKWIHIGDLGYVEKDGFYILQEE